MPTIASMADVTNTTLITPASGNVTNRNMRLPNPTEMLAVSMPNNPTYYKAEKITGVSGLPLTWQDMIDALNKNTGASYWDRNYTVGADDPWQITATRVNTT